MKRSSWLRLGMVTLVGGLLAASCGSSKTASSPASTAAGGTTGTAAAGATTAGATTGTQASSAGKSTITLVQNNWTASALDTEIAKQLIEKNLGNKVDVKILDENNMWPGLSSGELDAVMEWWPSGINADKQKYLDDKTVVKVGPLGVTGQIGWFVPDYVLTAHPELKTWEGFKDPAIDKLFASAETGSSGRFLGTDPSYSQYDATIIDNLKLPLKVVYSGSEAATVAALDSAVSAKKPILMYWWTPTAASAQYHLVNIALPKFTDGCRDDAAKVTCDYPADPLQKLASSKLQAKDAKVYSFLQKFTLTNDDQIAMLPAAEIQKEDVSKVAAKWITDHESIWKAWLA